MFRRHTITITLLLFHIVVSSQPVTDKKLTRIFADNHDTIFQKVIRQPDSFRLQIIYTEIKRDKSNKPHFTNYYFNYDPEMYFNPASMVKMPLAFLALEKLNELNKPGVNKYTTILFDSSKPWQKAYVADKSSETGLPSIAHLIKRTLLISENDPYNRLYQFIGQQQINRSLKSKGYNVRITRQFLGLPPEENRHTNAVRFLDKDGKILYHQLPAYNTDSFDFSKVIKLGKAHWNSKDSLINEPFDFTVHNYLPLESMQQMLQSVMFPAFVAAKQRFNLTEDDYNFLYRYLSQYPSETSYPKYDTSKFYDSYVKFFFYDGSKKMPQHIRVFNKVGWAYGFMTDVSYVIDTLNKVEFMLAATIYLNSDGVINDGKYDYETIGYPFMYQLGKTIYQHELKRKRKYSPDLSAFKIEYDKRLVNDARPSLKQVDN